MKGTESEDGFMLQYRLPEQQALKYDFQSSTLQKMEVMGQQMEIDIRSALLFSLNSNGLKEEVNETKVTIDSMFLSVKSPRGDLSPNMKNVVGKSFALRLSTTGKELEMKGTESIDYELASGQKQNATAVFNVLFPDLAAKRVKPGDTWTSKDTIRQTTSNGNVRIILESQNTLAGFEAVGGRECAKIISQYVGPLRSEEAQGPMNFVTEGTMKGIDTVYFAYKEGVLVSVKTNATLEAVAQGTGPQNISIPIKREMKNELRLTAAPPPKEN
jgi:hypothetical protein